MRFIQFRSAPAQKALPAPASTTARTVSSLSRCRRTSVKLAIRTSSKALRTSGRFNVTMATRFLFSTIRLSGMVVSGDAGFDDDCALYGIGDEAALMRFFMQLFVIFNGGCNAREPDHRPQRDARHRFPAFVILRKHAGSFIAVALDHELAVAGQLQEPEHVAG